MKVLLVLKLQKECAEVIFLQISENPRTPLIFFAELRESLSPRCQFKVKHYKYFYITKDGFDGVQLTKTVIKAKK